MATVDTAAPVAPATPDAVVAAGPAKDTVHAPGKYVDLSVKEIVTRAGDNVRTGELTGIEGLVDSIKSQGILAPIVVTASTEVAGKFTVIAGHRRLTAVRSLGWPTIPAVVVDADTERRLKMALIENIQREEMRPLDKAKTIAKILKSTGMEQGVLAQSLGVAAGYISQYVMLLELPEEALTALGDETLSFTQARSLCRLLPDMKAIAGLLKDAEDMTVAALDAKVSFLVAQAEKAAAAADDEADGEKKPKKTKKAKAAVATDAAVAYYEEADFKPLKKEEIRDVMIDYKRKELKADTAEKKEEFRLILKGITIAADLRLK